MSNQNKPGEFIWFELMTSDLDAASRFYEAVVGWEIAPSQHPQMDYRHVSAAGSGIAGMMQIDADMAAHGARPMWVPYIGVADVDASAVAITEKGGHLYVPPRDIPGVGRFAMAADPQGGAFYVMRGFPDQRSEAFSSELAGHCCWADLRTSDPEAGLAFYGGLFGWTKGGTIPIGPGAEYWFLNAGDLQFGGTFRVDGPARWQLYFRVPSIAAASETIRANGGAVTSDPHQVPTGEIVITATDPAGASFGLAGGA